MINGQYIHHKPTRAMENKKTYWHIENNAVKEIIIPDRNPTEEPAILTKSEFERLNQEAKVLTATEKAAMLEEAEREKNQIKHESNQRKEYLKKTQKIQKAIPGSKLEQEETEAANKNFALIKRSKELQIEQDDRVKQLNRIILATKCRAIRQAQVAEKKLLEDQLQEENKRLDMMMEQSRLQKVDQEQRKRDLAEIRRQKYTKEIRQQVKENEMQQLIEAEKLEEESRTVNKALIAIQKEDQEKQIEKNKLKLKLRGEFLKATADAEFFKSIKEEESKIMDMRVKEFQRQKKEFDDAVQREKDVARAAWERAQQRMAEGHNKSYEQKEVMENLKYQRAAEEKEKEWRERERLEAEKRKSLIEDLKKTRAQQIQDIRKAQAVALARDEQSFKKVASVQWKLHEQHMEAEKKRKEEQEKHRKYLLQQINEKEKERIKEHMEKYEDGIVQREEIALKKHSIDEYLQQKIEKLRNLNFSENYIKDIKRQAKSLQV